MDAPKTIRDEIRRRSQATSWVGAAIGVGFGIVGVAFGIGSYAVRTQRFRLSPQVPLFVFFGLTGLVAIATFLIKRLAPDGVDCPKCAASLRPFILMLVGTPKSKAINFCPYCAVNLDDPMPEAPPPAENVTTPDKLVWK